ncbi:UNVERIFIED_CONTAM: hypothetical protein GTU68_034305 [Idotea baltica]|nr:hypothetical protein [Idotea baltica]
MTPVTQDGLFEVELKNNPGLYQLEFSANEHTWQAYDPYAFSSAIGELDHHLFGEGTHQQLYKILGSHITSLNGVNGVHFGVWAPNAKRVSVIGEFNEWDGRIHCMRKHPSTGIWDIFVPALGNITLYKYEIVDEGGAVLPLKNDPYAPYFEQPPGNASIVFNSEFIWSDEQYLEKRNLLNPKESPIAIYEVHAGSWRKHADDRTLSYRELADSLIAYVVENHFTHIELMPITEHPFTGSWGYQPIGLYAPTSRFGSPDDFRYFVDQCHAENIGVIMDWVPAHFPTDEHGLGLFDGTHLYEHADPRQGFHQDWETLIYNYGRREVANYLYSNAVYWIREFHLDGLRVDAVASMLYLDYSHGGRENLEAMAFLKRMNELVHAEGGMTLAEESTSFPGVSHPPHDGGLGFTFKWNMGWMHDSLTYMSKDSAYRKYHHNELTFGLIYAFSESFLLPISHDEVVYGKGSLLGKMPGDDWQRLANLRAFFAYMYMYPGKKLMFMGSEIAQLAEWSHDGSVHWDLLDNDANKKMLCLVRDLNNLYQSQPSLYEGDCIAEGFDWIDCADSEQSIVSFYRYASGSRRDKTIVVCNFTPIPRHDYRIGIDDAGEYVEVINTDAAFYGGTDLGNLGRALSKPDPCHDRPHSLSLTLPPLSVIALRRHA